MAARGSGVRLHCYCQSNVAARGRGLDCIVIGKVMWQQGVGVRLHCYCQSNVTARGTGLDCIVIAKVMWPQWVGG